jgi:hypothetical protein
MGGLRRKEGERDTSHVDRKSDLYLFLNKESVLALKESSHQPKNGS